MKKGKEIGVMLFSTKGWVRLKRIPNTIKALQKLVKGPIETFKFFTDKDVVMLRNKNGNRKKMAPNPYFPGVVGDVVFCRVIGEEFASPTIEQIMAIRYISPFLKLRR